MLEKAPRISDTELEKYRDEITSLYTEQGATLVKVMKKMKERHGFEATLTQFFRKLRDWGVSIYDSDEQLYRYRPLSNGIEKTFRTKRSYSDYTVGWICALPVEMYAARAMFDIIHPNLPLPPKDKNFYTFGEIFGHGVILACNCFNVYETSSTSTIDLQQMTSTFPDIRFCLLVGIGGGVQSKHVDIRLGDVVVSMPTTLNNGLVQYDLGSVARLKEQHIFQGSDIPKQLSKLAERHPDRRFNYPGQEFDRLFKAECTYDAAEDTTDNLDDDRLVQRLSRDSSEPTVHYGSIAFTNRLIKDAIIRDNFARYSDILCFAMEATGLQDGLPCLAIRGICDYADSHKYKKWQDYAAGTAAAFAKELLGYLPVEQPESSGISLIKNSLAYNNIDSSTALELMPKDPAMLSIYSIDREDSIADRLKLPHIDSRFDSPEDFLGLGSQFFSQRRLEKMPGETNVGLEGGSIESHDGELLKRSIEAPPKRLINDESKDSPAPSVGDQNKIISIFSEGTGNSSISSLDGSGAADKELAYMFLTDTKMRLLLFHAFSQVNLEKFSRNVQRLIFQYGGNLESEASEEIQKQAAKYVRRSANWITICITRAMRLEVRVDELSKSEQVNDWLELFLGRKELSSRLEAARKDWKSSSETEEEKEIDDEFYTQTLLEVQTFLKTAKAFKTLENELQQWLTPGKRQSLEAEQQQHSGAHLFLPPQDLSGENIRKDTETPQDLLPCTGFDLSATPKIWKGIMPTIWYKIVPLLWTKPPEGYKRITWQSAIGRPLYIDVKEMAEGAAKNLQERFRCSAVKETSSSSSQPFSETSLSLKPITAPSVAHIRSDGRKSSPADHRRSSSIRTELSDHDTYINSNERRYLLLCFSTHKSETFRQIDVTELENDQYLFTCIHDAYRELKEEECWYSKVPFVKSSRLPAWILWILGDLDFYTPKEVNFVSFSLLPRWTTPCPVNIKGPSLPPEVEVRVHRNWHYHPCPREVEDFRISQTFVLQLFEPGHAFLDNAWLELFPKKLRSELIYEPGRMIVAWGIQIVEGLNAIAIAWMLSLISILSGTLAVIFSACTKDVGGAFTIAAWLVATSTLLTIYFQLRR